MCVTFGGSVERTCMCSVFRDSLSPVCVFTVVALLGITGRVCPSLRCDREVDSTVSYFNQSPIDASLNKEGFSYEPLESEP